MHMLLSIAKLQNLKAIHNWTWKDLNAIGVVINRKTTKFESNSQLWSVQWMLLRCCYQSQNYKIWKQFTTIYGRGFALESCYQSQNYKIWKQFTTYNFVIFSHNALLSIAKLQNLKAIHNKAERRKSWESVVINHKTTKFESNSQRTFITTQIINGCYQSQNYKIWKQFTTASAWWGDSNLLLSIAKLQNLKAIHNIPCI